MILSELNDHYGLPGALAFDEHDGLPRAQITLPGCTATVYLHGAHLTHWQPTGTEPVLFLSAKSEFADGKAIRGGIPVCFPWFGPRSDGNQGPSHGFARLQEWTLAFAALIPGDEPALHLTFTLAPSDLSRSLGFDAFQAAYEMIFAGSKLTLRLSVANPGTAPLKFEEALHTYFHVADVHNASITGLELADFLDKTDGMKQKTTPPTPLKLTAQTDRVFAANIATTHIHDPGYTRSITVAKQNSATTVVWNPWDTASASLPDMAPTEWPTFLCVETANTGASAITLAPGEAHTMQAAFTVSANTSNE